MRREMIEQRAAALGHTFLSPGGVRRVSPRRGHTWLLRRVLPETVAIAGFELFGRAGRVVEAARHHGHSCEAACIPHAFTARDVYVYTPTTKPTAATLTTRAVTSHSFSLETASSRHSSVQRCMGTHKSSSQITVSRGAHSKLFVGGDSRERRMPDGALGGRAQ